MANIEEKIEKLVKQKIEDLGYELYDVIYTKEGKDYFLKIFIDSKQGISVDDCQKVNDNISDLLDKADYIKEQYFLEVSSPGIERILRKDKHMEENIGEQVEINLFNKVDGEKQKVGILKSFSDTQVILEGDIYIDRKNISLIKKKYNWEERNEL